jgi:hypothetical protein
VPGIALVATAGLVVLAFNYPVQYEGCWTRAQAALYDLVILPIPLLLWLGLQPLGWIRYVIVIPIAIWAILIALWDLLVVYCGSGF